MTNPTIVKVVVAVEVHAEDCAPGLSVESTASGRVMTAISLVPREIALSMSIPECGTIDPIATEAAKDPPPESMADEGVTA